MTIRRVGGMFRLVSKTGKNLGTFKTKREAHVREGQVQAFKRKKRKQRKKAA